MRIRSCGFPTAHPEINRGDRDIAGKVGKMNPKTVQKPQKHPVVRAATPKCFPNSYLSGGRCDALLAELDDASLWEVKSPRWYSSPLRSLQGFSQWLRTRKRSSCSHKKTCDTGVALEWLNRLSNGFRYRRRLTQWWPH